MTNCKNGTTANKRSLKFLLKCDTTSNLQLNICQVINIYVPDIPNVETYFKPLKCDMKWKDDYG